MPTSDFPALLAAALRRSPGDPLVTFYDDATGERVELSVTTYANWVAKTAGLLQDELGLERGGTLLVELPTHWLGPVWLGAAWAMGLAVTDTGTGTDPGTGPVDAVVCGPDGVAAHAGGSAPVVALSLLPMGAAFREPLPDGVLDYGRVVWGQPDAFLADEAPEPSDVAWRGAGGPLTQAEVLGVGDDEDDGRLLTDLNPCTHDGLATLVAALRSGAGAVWVRNPASDGWERRAASEQATRVRRREG